jgi:type IV pilus assembly protein PilM
MAKPFLCIDFGAGTLKMGEFEHAEGGSLKLVRWAVKPLGPEGTQEAAREAIVLQKLREAIAEKGFVARKVNICAPGSQVFSKFVKLPGESAAKLAEIIQYEAQQNVPFPLAEVVWNYQLLGMAADGSLEVLLVAIKKEVVEAYLRICESAKLDLQLVDVSHAALVNCFRFNYSDQEGCSMLLDIGAKTSNLLFFEKAKSFSRGINIGANSITNDFANESRVPFADAEKLKIEEGFVSLGGAYEDPNSPHQALISKIARQVMTRLHIQMNQTVQFYRGQQGGTAPQRLYLAGGASLMPYTAQFFAEKINTGVEYLNPFRTVEIDHGVTLEELAKHAHTFGEVVGLAIRNLAQCPVELNLMPDTHRKRQEFSHKRGYFIASIFSVILVVFAMGRFYHWASGKKAGLRAELQKQFGPMNKAAERINEASKDLDEVRWQAQVYEDVLKSRVYWSEILSNLQDIFIRIEASPPVPDGVSTNERIQAGVWIERLTPYDPTAGAAAQGGARIPSQTDPNTGQPQAVGGIHFLNLDCRAINLKKHSASANTEFVLALQDRFKTNQMFLPDGTTLTNRIEDVDATNISFTFAVTLQLKRPIRTQ